MRSLRLIAVLCALSVTMVLSTACRTEVALPAALTELHSEGTVTPEPATVILLPATALPTAVLTVTTPTPAGHEGMFPTAVPTVTAELTYTATATVEPATPMPTTLTIAVPTGWEADLQAVLDRIVEPRWSWRLLGAEDPEAELAAGRADLALGAGEGDLEVGSLPLVLAVPFATEWDNTDLAHARQIVANGHSLVRVMLWEEIRPPLRALRVNGLHPSEPDYPLRRSFALHAGESGQDALAFLAPILSAYLARDDAIEIAAVGDINLDRALGAIIAGGRVDFPFAQVAPILQAADVAVGNLECALGDVGSPAEKSYAFRAPPAGAESLARAGFDVITLANNHAMDYGPEALLQGIDLLRGQQLAAVGAGENASAARAPAILEVNGLRVAFLGYVQVPVEGRPPYFDTASWEATSDAPGLAWAHPDDIAADVTAARSHSDLVIVILHSGLEYVPAPSPEQTAASYAAIDAGASLVVGHHAHVLQGVEFYKEGVIVYGLANFAFNIIGPPETAILQAWLDADGVRTIEFVPALVQESGQPRPADEAEAALIRQAIYRMSGGLVR